MADPTTPATPAGDTGATIDVNAITQAAVKAATEAATAAVTEAIKPVTEQVKSLQDGLSKAPTTEAINQAVADAIAQQTASQEKSGARQQFIAEKLKDVPDAYHSMIGDDPEKFAEQEQKLRAVLKGDLEKLGVKAPDVGSPGSDGGQKVTAAVDTSKLSGIELIRQGVQQTSGNASSPGGNTNTAATKPAADHSGDGGGDTTQAK